MSALFSFISKWCWGNDRNRMRAPQRRSMSRRGWKEKGRAAEWGHFLCITFLQRTISAETQRANIYPLAIMQVGICHVILHPAWLGERATHQRWDAADATISISKAHTSRHHWHPPPRPTPPHSPNFKPKHHISIFPSFLRLLTPLFLSLLVLLQCCYSNGEMWEYLRPSECGAGGF